MNTTIAEFEARARKDRRAVDLIYDAPGRLISERQVCDALEVSTATVRRWRLRESDPLGFRRLPNGQLRFEVGEIRAWLSRNEPKDGGSFRRGGLPALA